uniref:Uncharacterized protein n=1 Tax=Anguilla anguilla TaxID=7936 RepID=A0A0E9RVL7_ANGAN
MLNYQSRRSYLRKTLQLIIGWQLGCLLTAVKKLPRGTTPCAVRPFLDVRFSMCV